MDGLADLPVLVDLDEPLRDEVVRWAESEAGWQVIAAGGPLAPAVTLGRRPGGRGPWVGVVEGPPDAVVLRDGLRAGALDVIAWPSERHRLLSLSLPPVPAQGSDPQLVAVAGTAGGAGASTVALAVGGLLAWAGRTVAVVGEADLLALAGTLPWDGPGAAELRGLDGATIAEVFASVARPVPGVPGLTVLRGDGAAVGGCSGWPVDAVVADRRGGVLGAPGAEAARVIVVSRPDGSAGRAAGVASPCTVLVVGEGPLRRTALRRALGREPDGWLPASARVARAGLAGRVPAGLPGRWLRELREALGGRS